MAKQNIKPKVIEKFKMALNKIAETKDGTDAIVSQKITGDNIYKYLLCFEQFYDKFSDIEKKLEGEKVNGLTRREREVTDIDKILEILDKSKVVHIGLVDGDEAYVVPMNYGYTYENEKLTLYLHGARRGRKLDLMRQNPKVFFEMECDINPFEGEVACKYGITYSSIMGRGIAEILENPEEKMRALSVLMKTQTNKDFEFNEKLVSVVAVIKIDVTNFTAKHRPAPKQ